MRVLITQAEPDAETTAAALRARGHTVLSAPLLSAERTPSPKIDLAGAQGFVVTGEEGARALADNIGVRTFPVFTDSEVTAATLKALGFKSVFAAKDDHADLARLIERSVKSNAGALIHACSTQPGVHLGALLGNNGFALRALPLYAIRRASALPPDVLAALKSNAVDAALFLSPEEARAFVALAQQASLALTNLAAVAATPAVAAPLRALKLRAVTVPTGAGVAGVIDALDGALVDKVAEERRVAEARMREEAERLRVQEEAAARAKAEADAAAQEAAERERLKREADERARQERLAQERAAAEQARAEKEKRAAEDKARQDAVERERQQRLAVERSEKEKRAAEEAERERQRHEAVRAQTEAERQARAVEEAARKEAAERARQERLAQERAATEQARTESERQAAIERERKRVAAEEAAIAEEARRQEEAARLSRTETENARRAREIAERKRAQAEFAAQEREDAARREKEAAASQNAAREQEAAERAAQQRAAAARDAEALASREQQERLAAEERRVAAEAQERADREQAEAAQQEAERAAQEYQRRAQAEAARIEALRIRDAAIRAEDEARERDAAERKRLEAERRAEQRAVKKAEDARRADEKRAQRAAKKEERRQAKRNAKQAVTGGRRWWQGFARTENAEASSRGKWDMPLAETSAQEHATVSPEPASDASPPSHAPDLSSSEASATMTLAALGELIASKPQHAAHPAATTEPDMDVSPAPEQQPPPKSAPPDPQPMARGGSAARLLAEDAADDKAQAQRLRHFGASETSDTESEPADSTPARRRGGGWRAATLFIVLLAVTATVFKTAPHWVPRVTALIQTPAAPSPQVAQTQTPAPTPAVTPEPAPQPAPTPAAQEIKPAPAAPAPAVEPGGLGETLANQARQLAALTARVATLEAALGNTARLDEMNQRLGALEGKAADAGSVLALSQRVATLESTERRAAAAQATAVGFLTSLGQWRETLAAGRPFSVELETVKALAGPIQIDDSGFASYARDGLPTVAELERRFEPVSIAVVRASLIPDTTSNWLRRVLDRVMTIVTVRRTDDTTGTGTTAVVARAEHRLTAGDLDGATKELQGLQGAAAEAAGPWLAQAHAREAADRALDDATSKALAALAAAQKSPEATP